MDDINILVAIAIFMAGIFAMAGLRLWYITHQDVNMSKKINGLSIDMGKLKKQLKDGLAAVQQRPIENTPNTNINAEEMADQLEGLNLENMSLEEAAESIGIDPEQLNNPLIRPMAEKIFEGIKAKAKGGDDANGVGTEAGY